MDWPLIARADELGQLTDVLGSATPGSVVLAGPAGVGKTRLLDEAACRVSDAGRRVHRVVCSAASVSIPFGAFSHLLPVPDGRDATRLELLARARQVLLEDAGEVPPVITVDDAHLLDDGSATLVHQLAAGGEAILVLTVRTGESSPAAVQQLWKDDLARRIDLANLDRDDVQTVVETGLGAPLEPAALDELARLSEGNPLFLRELVVGALDDGTLEIPSSGAARLTGPLTPSVRLAEIVEARLERLQPPEREVAELLALAEPLEVDLLERLAPSNAVEQLERRQVVSLHESGRRRRFRLAHPVYAEVLRAGMPHTRRRRMAGEVADALAAYGGRRRGNLLRLATFQLDSGGPGDGELFTRAAELALDSFDYELAERLAEAAVRDGGHGLASCLALGKALARQNRPAEAEAHFARAAAHAATDVDRTRVALARARCRFFRARDHEAASEVLRTADAAVDDEDCRDELEAMQALFASLFGDLPRASEAGRRILTRPDAHPRAVRATLAVSVFSDVLLGRFATAGEAIAVGLQAAATEDSAPLLATDLLRAYQAMLDAYAGRVQAAEAAARAGFAEATAERADVAGPWGDVLCHVLILRGKVAEAGAVGDRTIQLLGGRDPFAVAGMTLAGWAFSAALRRDEATVTGLLGQLDAATFRGDPRPGIFADLARARLRASTGESSAAADLAREAGVRAVAGTHLVWGSFLLHEAVRFGHPEGVVDPLRQLAGEVEGKLIPTFAVHATALAEGDADRLAEVAETFARSGAQLHAAEAAGQAASWYRRAQRSQQARRWAGRARSLAAGCEGAWAPALALPGEELTTREREIAMLAAQGLPSKQIAARLVVSVRTVDNHLRAVYRKLGVVGRAELAPILQPATDASGT